LAKSFGKAAGIRITRKPKPFVAKQKKAPVTTDAFVFEKN